MQVIVLISVLMSIATGPVNLLVDALFRIILAAPIVDEYKADLHSRRLNCESSLHQMYNNVQVFSSLSDRMRRAWAKLLQKFVLPGAATREFPAATVRSYEMAAVVLRGALARRRPAASSRSHVARDRSPSLAERGELLDDEEVVQDLFESFCNSLSLCSVINSVEMTE